MRKQINKQILQIAVPSIVSNITVPLLGLIDVTIVGHLGAASYIGAIAVGGMLFNIIYWIFGFLRMGTSGMTSQAYGRNDLNETTRLLLRSITISLLIALSLLFLQYPIHILLRFEMLALFILSLCLISFQALANPACAVCTVAVGASLEIARRLGVDDAVVGVWSGAFLLLLGYWTLKWMDKKNYFFKGRDFIVLALSVAMIGFIYISHLVYTPKVILFFWIDPFLFATICGALVLHYSSEFYQWMKRNNGGHAHFPFEKVVVPVVALALTSWLFAYLQLCTPALPDLSNI